MGSRGTSKSSSGSVIITKEAEPNKQGFAYYMTGSRTVISNWDDEGNYSEAGFKQQESIRMRFNTKEEAIKYAKENDYDYMNF